MATSVALPVEIVVSPDGLTASVRRRERWSRVELSDRALLEAVLAAGIKLDDRARERIRAMPSLLAARDGCTESLALTSGTPPIPGDDGVFEACTLPEPSRIGPFQIHADPRFRGVTWAARGACLGRLKPATPGWPGVDVRGAAIAPRPGKPIVPGANVQVTDTAMVVASIAGRVVSEQLRVDVIQARDVCGDLDAVTNDLETSGDVVVHGSIASGRRVSVAGALFVGGTIEAASILCGGDLRVAGGVVGRGAANILVTRDFDARHCADVDVACGGDARIARDLVNCRISAEGRLLSSQGTAIGGRLYARRGIDLHAAGSRAELRTHLVAGPRPDLYAQLRELHDRLDVATEQTDRLSARAKLLQQQLAHLSAEQREAVEGLINDLHQTTAMLERQRDHWRRCEAEAQFGAQSIRISGAVYPGVVFQFGDRFARVRQFIDGPLRVSVKLLRELPVIVAINERTGGAVPLTTERTEHAVFDDA